MASNFPTSVDVFAAPGPTDPRTAPSLAAGTVSIQEAIAAVETWLRANIYAPAGGVLGQFLQLDSNGHPVFNTVDVVTATSPLFKKVDNVHEGGEIRFEGSNTNPIWTQDLNDATMRFISGSTGVLNLTPGTVNVKYSGGATLKMDTDDSFVSLVTDASENLTVNVGATAVAKFNTADLLSLKLASTYYPVTYGARRIFMSTGAPSGGVDGDIWLKYT